MSKRFLGGAVILFFAQALLAQTLTLLTEVKPEGLTPKQEKILTRIRSAPATISLLVVKLEEDQLKASAEPIELPLPPNGKLKMTGYKVEADPENPKKIHFVWQSEKNDHGITQNVSITYNKETKTAYGFINTWNANYSIEALSGGLQAFRKYDASKLPGETSGQWRRHGDQPTRTQHTHSRGEN